MPIPTHEDAMLPVLRVLSDGQPRHRRVLADIMADHFQLSPEERAIMLPSGKSPVIRSRTGWALSFLKQAALVRTVKRGVYEITPRGRDLLSRKPSHLSAEDLEEYPEFQEFLARRRSSEEDGSDVSDTRSVPIHTTPDEALEGAYTELRATVEAELLETIKSVSPAFFEQLVIDLLVRMGYGGNRQEAARAVGRSGDGGIDGVIDEDRLGLDVIYVQAKRWDAVVGRPEIQKFAGALQGQRARKGIFITTSGFSKDAASYAERIETRVVLIDGKRLAALMFDNDVGVSPRRSYVVKAVDGDYFEDA